MGETGHLSLDDLLAHADWLGRLARHLAGPEQSEDAVQETWLAARRAAPERGRSPRPWLAEVLRNQIRARWQRDARRRRREEAAALLEADCEAAVDAVYERVELQRTIAERVMALEHPLRTVVLLRYFEGRDSAEIAALLRIPAGTVRWRLKTALDRLRAELNARSGPAGDDGRSWRRLVVPGPLALRFLGWPVLAGALLVAAATGLTLQRARSTVASTTAARTPAGRPRASGADGDIIEGTVLDDGRPVPDALVVASRRWAGGLPTHRPPRWARSGRDGRFRLAMLGPGRYLVTAVGLDRGVAPAQAVELPSRDLALSLVRAGATLEGRVLDAGAGAIARARVRATRADGADDPAVYEAQSVCLGRYRLEIPPGAYAIEVEADGYAPVRFTTELRWAGRRDFWLQPGARAGGRVLDIVGHPVAGAALVARPRDDDQGELHQADADTDGSFVFTWLAPGTYDVEARRGDRQGRRQVTVGEAARLDGVDVTVTDRGGVP